MDESILRWSQSAEAQPYLQKVAMGSQGQSYGGGMDQYGSYLTQLINANQNNPSLQKELLGYYLDYSNPQNQQVDEENKLATAQTLLSAGEDSPLYAMGLSLLQEVYPQIGQTAGGYGAPETYEDVLRQKAQGLMEKPTELDRPEYDWQKFLMNASDEQVRLYEEAKKKTVGFGSYWKGTGARNPFDASFWSPEARARAKLGYTDF